MNRTQALVTGSLGAIAQRDGTSIAETFMQAEIVAVVDVSGSMDARDSRGGRRRYDVACEELARLQTNNPGKVAVVSFSNNVQFCPSGIPVYEGGGTDLARALEFVKVADGTVKFIVISDGQPNNEEQALRIARTFTSKIHCVYVGPEEDRYGAEFLERLAQATGGRYAIATKAHELAEKVETLLLTAG